MKKAVLIKSLLPLAATSLLVAADAQADWSGTVSLNSDYTFNGVSQTQNNPALQGSIDYSADNGWYAGTWASNIDYAGDETKLEWDGYTGYYQELTDSLSLDTGIAYYTYQGADYSSDYNYPEVYASFNHGNKLGNTELNFWYSWDYFGLGGGHSIIMLAHSFEVAPGHTIRISGDRSNSHDEQAWSWDGDNDYYHWRLAYLTSYQGFDFSLAAEDTTMDLDRADARIVASVSRTFSF